MNVASSRSHTLLLLTLLRREGLDDGTAAAARPCREVVSQLSLVDLAGSERSVAREKSSTRFQERWSLEFRYMNLNLRTFLKR